MPLDEKNKFKAEKGQDIVDFFENEGKKEFPINISRQALLLVKCMGNAFDYEEFMAWHLENHMCVSGGHVLSYLQSKANNEDVFK